MTDTRTIFASGLKRAIDRAGITQTELGERIGSSRQEICRWAGGDILPRAEKIDLICNALGHTPAELFFTSDQQKTYDMGKRLLDDDSIMQLIDSVSGLTEQQLQLLIQFLRSTKSAK